MAEHVLIIGAGGYLGAHISQYLSRQGFLVTAFCRHPQEDATWTAAMHRTIYGDITSPTAVEQILSYDYDYVIYLISLNHFDSEGESEQICRTNVLPLWMLEENLKDKVKKFIYFSTQQVYGRTKKEVITEEYPPAPVNNYGLTHLLCENITHFFDRQSATQFINVRLSNGYGAPVFDTNNCWWLVINDLCKTAFLEKCIQLQSDGSPLRDFIHTKDICRAIDCLLRQETGYNLYHIASGITCTIGEIALKVQEVYRERYQETLPITLPTGTKLQTTNNTKNSTDNKRLKELGFYPQVDLQSGINLIFEYLENKL